MRFSLRKAELVRIYQVYPLLLQRLVLFAQALRKAADDAIVRGES